MSVEVVNSSPVLVDEEAIRRWAEALLQRRNAAGDVTVALVGLDEMAGLNLRYRGVEGPTDVLSFVDEEANEEWIDFPEGEDAAYLGDVVISPEVARSHALEEGGTLSSELKVLVVHGVLHLLGLDHERDQGEMLEAQDELVRKLDAELPQDLV